MTLYGRKNGENEEQVPISTVKEGDFVVFRDGAMITFDGVVVSGQASVNEASMTGESVAAVRIRTVLFTPVQL